MVQTKQFTGMVFGSLYWKNNSASMTHQSEKKMHLIFFFHKNNTEATPVKAEFGLFRGFEDNKKIIAYPSRHLLGIKGHTYMVKQ